MFLGKKITCCICGSLFAYRIPEVICWLTENGAEVQIALSTAALDFVSPKVMSGLSGNTVAIDMFTLDEKWQAMHIDIAECDLLIIAPADRDVLAKLALGIADELISTTYLATAAPVLIVPDPDIDFSCEESMAKDITILLSNGHYILDTNKTDNRSYNEIIDSFKTKISGLLINR